eukprot:16445838-Heterocapsa_arctica.AAC.1
MAGVFKAAGGVLDAEGVARAHLRGTKSCGALGKQIGLRNAPRPGRRFAKAFGMFRGSKRLAASICVGATGRAERTARGGRMQPPDASALYHPHEVVIILEAQEVEAREVLVARVVVGAPPHGEPQPLDCARQSTHTSEELDEQSLALARGSNMPRAATRIWPFSNSVLLRAGRAAAGQRRRRFRLGKRPARGRSRASARDLKCGRLGKRPAR